MRMRTPSTDRCMQPAKWGKQAVVLNSDAYEPQQWSALQDTPNGEIVAHIFLAIWHLYNWTYSSVNRRKFMLVRPWNLIENTLMPFSFIIFFIYVTYQWQFKPFPPLLLFSPLTSCPSAPLIPPSFRTGQTSYGSEQSGISGGCRTTPASRLSEASQYGE